MTYNPKSEEERKAIEAQRALSKNDFQLAAKLFIDAGSMWGIPRYNSSRDSVSGTLITNSLYEGIRIVLEHSLPDREEHVAQLVPLLRDELAKGRLYAHSLEHIISLLPEEDAQRVETINWFEEKYPTPRTADFLLRIGQEQRGRNLYSKLSEQYEREALKFEEQAEFIYQDAKKIITDSHYLEDYVRIHQSCISLWEDMGKTESQREKARKELESVLSGFTENTIKYFAWSFDHNTYSTKTSTGNPRYIDCMRDTDPSNLAWFHFSPRIIGNIRESKHLYGEAAALAFKAGDLRRFTDLICRARGYTLAKKLLKEKDFSLFSDVEKEEAAYNKIKNEMRKNYGECGLYHQIEERIELRENEITMPISEFAVIGTYLGNPSRCIADSIFPMEKISYLFK